MANHEHVALLRQGVHAWNEWRQENPDIRADLTGAHLSEADLSGARLTWAVLSGADLSGADLTRADLNGADPSGARLYQTSFTNTDLTDTVGLETCQHHGPSPIDHQTLRRSRNLPASFLRGCGLSDWALMMCDRVSLARLYFS